MSSDAITASEARRRLFPLLDQVNEDHQAIEIVHRGGNAVLVSKADWDSLQETAYLLRTPANAAWLSQAMNQLHRGEAAERELDRS
jgi:antitoxin YefM